MQINKLFRPSVGVEYANERIDPGIRMGDRAGADLSALGGCSYYPE
jgi:hypothetical protein